ncbi:phage/plasmid replication protein, II/X family [Moraxella sp. VT-16-12]|uniref:phage/plasmid replication protein, II/X family n=1 Tax=Moraxella sp. VT-16-12 TaxID=2014877 RepID=UPI000B7E146E|nr:phage/plasmid replication protein, II/X family [Moraxella sp. VT-16-12]TWV80177.1 hypothetical protein CEW93_010475 [Moraxella sp. VT-16-12]
MRILPIGTSTSRLAMLMIDTVAITIPVFKTYARLVDGSKTKWELIGDVNDYGLVASSRHIIKRDGTEIAFEKYHPFESIPTSHTGIAFKFYHQAQNSLPYVYLNASIAKILQGHNVCGNTDMIVGVCEILGYFSEFAPEFIKYLDFANAQISRFDVTLPMQVANLFVAQKVREYIRNVDWGRLKNLNFNQEGDFADTLNTVYFGAKDSKVGGFKVYCKGIELFNKEIYPLEKKARKGNLHALARLNILHNDLREYAKRSVRVECKIAREMIRRQDYPLNLWQFLEFQLFNQHIYQELFFIKTKDFFNALQGMDMTTYNDAKVKQLLIDKLTTVTPTGKKSQTRALNAYRFYLDIKENGYYEVKADTHKATFSRKVSDLIACGFSRSYLQNLTKDNKELPVLRILNLDANLSAPNPSWYQTPATQYLNEFKRYFPINKVA